MAAPGAPLRIANCSGFLGDRLSAAREMLEGGPIDVLTGEYLAELTMLLLWKARERDPDGGYATTFLTQMEDVLGLALERGVRVVANAGGLNPAGLAARLRELLDRLGLPGRVAHLEGDDLLPRLGELQRAGHELRHADTGLPLAEGPSEPVTANVYLGAWGIVEALRAGADVVVCPRVTDASLVVGPAAWHFGWAPDDWDRLAGAVVAGHVIECGPQTTGGNYSFFREVPGLEHPGFPIAEVAGDGSAVITKHPGHGGLVSVGTVTAQLLYEIEGPRYANPDVVARFRHDLARPGRARPGADHRRAGRARARAPEGVAQPRGRLPEHDDVRPHGAGHRGQGGAGAARGVPGAGRRGAIPVGGRPARPLRPRRGEAERRGHRRAARHGQGPRPPQGGTRVLEPVHRAGPGELSGLLHEHAAAAREPLRRLLARARPAQLVEETVVLDGEGRLAVPQPPRAPLGGPVPESAAPDPRVDGRLVRAPLGTICGARSGDKGGNANVGVWARSEEGFRWLDAFLTTERLRELLPETAGLEIRRYRLPNLRALNFVVVGLLGEGVASSVRHDPQAKGLGEFLRSRTVGLPEALLEDAPAVS